MVKKKNDLNTALGQKQKVVGFLDGNERVACPIKLKDFQEFMEAFSSISLDKMWVNFLDPTSVEAVNKILEMTFKDYDLEEIMDNISAENFANIIDQIMKINGIEINREEQENADKKKE